MKEANEPTCLVNFGLDGVSEQFEGLFFFLVQVQQCTSSLVTILTCQSLTEQFNKVETVQEHLKIVSTVNYMLE